jgi:hypothetical protein
VVLDDPRRAARLAGLRKPRDSTDLSADAVELARRIGPVVGSLVPPEHRSRLLWHRLRPALAGFDGVALLVPDRHRPWLAERDADLRGRLTRGDYAVHGDLPPPVPRPVPRQVPQPGPSADSQGVAAPDDERVLALAMQVLLGAPIGPTVVAGEGV